MDKIKIKVLRVDQPSFSHDSRSDARILGAAVNILIKKVNELVDENEQLKQKIKLRELRIDATAIPQ